MRLTISVLALILTLGTATLSVAADAGGDRLSVALEAGVRWDDNINLGGDNPAEARAGGILWMKHDQTTRVALSADYALMRTGGSELVLGLTPFYERVNTYDDLSNGGATLSMAYRGEFGPAFTDPWYSASVDWTLARFDDSDIRDGHWVNAEVAVGKRFSPRFGVSGGARYFQRWQDDDDGLCPGRTSPGPDECPLGWSSDEVFDLQKWGGFVHGDWFLGDTTSFFVEYSYWDGDEAASGTFIGINNQDVFAFDPAFGTFRPTSPLPLWVWRVDAKQHVYELGVNYNLTDRVTLNLTALHLETSDVESPDRIGDKDVDNYRNTAVEFSATYSFR